MNNIQRLSHYLKLFFIMATLIIPMTIIAFWLLFNDLPSSLAMGALPLPLSSQHMIITENIQLNLLSRCLAMVITFIPAGLAMFGSYLLAKLFTSYESANIFTEKNTIILKQLGWLIIIAELIKPIYDTLLCITITVLNHPPLQRLIALNFGLRDIFMLITAIIIILIAHIMTEGTKLQKEQALTI